MSEHYFTQKPKVNHKPGTIEDILRGRRFQFVTDAGVFSKGGIDFGSKLLIETMEIAPDAKVLDIGCGYGPIGLAAAALANQGSVTMIDINERAVELALRNAKINGMGNVEILQSDLFSNIQSKMFNVIVCNPPIRAGKQIVHQIFDEAKGHLSAGGHLWVVIQNKQGAPSALEKLKLIYENVEEVSKKKGYRIYKATVK